MDTTRVCGSKGKASDISIGVTESTLPSARKVTVPPVPAGEIRAEIVTGRANGNGDVDGSTFRTVVVAC